MSYWRGGSVREGFGRTRLGRSPSRGLRNASQRPSSEPGPGTSSWKRRADPADGALDHPGTPSSLSRVDLGVVPVPGHQEAAHDDQMTVIEPARTAATNPLSGNTDQVRRSPSSSRHQAAWWCATAAAVLGVGYAAVSLVWALGGTWLLDTVGGGLAEGGRNGSPLVIGALWAAILLKLVAAVLPLIAVDPRLIERLRRPVRLLTGIEAAILTGYGAVLTTVGLLVQADIITASADADHWALAWHAFLWDPWFAAWGILVALALFLSRRHSTRG